MPELAAGAVDACVWIAVAGMELEILGMNFGCVVAALAGAKIPGKGCLLPLSSKLLGFLNPQFFPCLP
ncbi:hypothetical protein GUJ93_ZPchr0008g12134 [Zizania palustris]|uniref:Uncharacterized protein n=1 Tax=Zizania palustris TaxID=103762 RepID=A0A8J5UX77_ZIZPA|nr:hypothetical protein GUJ93_ZPchr0008g12134 [Zizania palustris]